MKNRRREPGRDVNILSDRMLRIKSSAGHSRCANLHALLNNFDTGFSAHIIVYCCIQYKCVLVKVLNLHRDQKSLARTGREIENSSVTQNSTHRGFY